MPHTQHQLLFVLIRILADGQYHPSLSLAQRLKTTPSAVRNALKMALGLGVEILAARGRGYRLTHNLDWLEKEAVLLAIGKHTKPTLQLEIHDVLDSTNRYLIPKVAHYTHPICVAAQWQLQGRGRRGRDWHSGLGNSLTFSLLWRFACSAEALGGLSLVVGVALIRALRGLGLGHAQLKWPNDVLVHGKKLAGVLIELQATQGSACIGVGLNLRLNAALQQRINQPATALQEYLSISASTLLGTLLAALLLVLNDFERDGFVSMRAEWNSYHAYHQQKVRLQLAGGQTIEGEVLGVAEDGALWVNTATGKQSFWVGDIQLRGVGA